MTAMEAYEAALDRALTDIAISRRAHDREQLRRKTAKYTRDTADLFKWTFPASREAIAMTNVYPYRPDITRALCHRIYRDLQNAREMPTFFRRRQVRIEVLRELFACECWLYRQQSKAKSQRNAEAGYAGLFETINQAAE